MFVVSALAGRSNILFLVRSNVHVYVCIFMYSFSILLLSLFCGFDIVAHLLCKFDDKKIKPDAIFCRSTQFQCVVGCDAETIKI